MKTTTFAPMRKTALTAGILYLLTFVSIPILTLYNDVRDPNYILISGPDNKIILGAILEVIVAITGIASAVVLYPVLKKENSTFALGLVAARVLEAGTIIAGIAFLLTIATLHQQAIGPEYLPTARALVALYDRMFLLGQSFMPAIDDLLLGYLLYRSKLVPRGLSVIGMIGAVPLLVSYLAMLTGQIEQYSPLASSGAILVALFEFTLGIYLVVKGFKAQR
jgi:hypothetical protein